jgi:hypothetical protein
MKIDRSNGLVYFEHGSIEPGTDRHSFLRSELGSRAEIFVSNEPHMTYRIRPEAGITATVYFIGDRLQGITWLHALPPEREREWNEALELERKKLHDRLLMKEFGEPPYHFAWGKISSEYDPKGCVSDIILDYAR